MDFRNKSKLMLGCIVGMALGGCSTASAGETTSAQGEGQILVVFFSHTGDNYAVGNIEVGNTKIVADIIAEKVGAEQFEIVAEKSYDMDYNSLIDVAKKEQKAGELPAYKGDVVDLDKYSTIFIGGPVWWGTYPQVMFTFFSKHDLNGKTLIPFTTHEGSGMAQCAKDIKKLFPKAEVKEGLAVRGAEAQAGNAKPRVEKWLKELGF